MRENIKHLNFWTWASSLNGVFSRYLHFLATQGLLISVFIPPWLLISPDLCYCALMCRLIWYCFIIKWKTLSVLLQTNSSALVCFTSSFLTGGAVLRICVTFSICDLAAGRRSLESGRQGLHLPLLLLSVLFSPSQWGILWLPPTQWRHSTLMHCTFSLSCQKGGKFWNSE